MGVFFINYDAGYCLCRMALFMQNGVVCCSDCCSCRAVLCVVQIVVNEDGIHSLLIMSATRQDSGSYTCVARNKAGEDTFSVTLTILGRHRALWF